MKQQICKSPQHENIAAIWRRIASIVAIFWKDCLFNFDLVSKGAHSPHFWKVGGREARDHYLRRSIEPDAVITHVAMCNPEVVQLRESIHERLDEQEAFLGAKFG